MSDPFASAQDFSQFIGVSLPTDLARMQQLLASASAAIRRYAGQTLSSVAQDIVSLNPVADDTLLLPERPVTAVSGVVIGAIPVSGTNYRVDGPRGFLIRTDWRWWNGSETPASMNPVYTVTYDHGYLEDSDEYVTIKTICMEAAGRAYTLNERSASETIDSTVMESAGYAPEVFLTMGEKMQLNFGKAYV